MAHNPCSTQGPSPLGARPMERRYAYTSALTHRYENTAGNISKDSETHSCHWHLQLATYPQSRHDSTLGLLHRVAAMADGTSAPPSPPNATAPQAQHCSGRSHSDKSHRPQLEHWAIVTSVFAGVFIRPSWIDVNEGREGRRRRRVLPSNGPSACDHAKPKGSKRAS